MAASTFTDDECHFAALQEVTIEAVSDTSVTFATRSASLSGDRNECLRRQFTVPLDEVLVTPIAGAPPPVPMTPGASGTLFLSRTGWQATTPDGFGIFGADQAVFKWPLCAAVTTRFLCTLTVIPKSIIVRGHLRDDIAFHDIELLGPDAAESQDLVCNGTDYLELQLTARGTRRLGVRSRSTRVQLWPTMIAIEGSPAIDQAVSGRVDILDSEMADVVQRVSFKQPGGPITLRLTQDGVNAFHVTPQAVAELSSHNGYTHRPCPGCVERDLEQTRQRVQGVIRRRPRI